MATRTGTARTAGRPALLSPATLAPLRGWSGRQWRVAAVGALVAFVLIGEVGQTLPPASVGRMFPVLWWNWLALAASAALLGLIAATFVAPATSVGPGRRFLGGAGGGAAGTVAAVAMACPVCSPLAIPLLGTGGLLAFLQPDRGWIALAAVALLSLTLLLRLRAAATCRVDGRLSARG